MSNAVLTSYSQHIFFHDETSERISLMFFPRLILSWQLLREFEPRADLFGSATVKKRDSARDVLSFRSSDCSFSKGCPDTDPPLLLSSIRRHICSRRYRQPRPGLGPSSNEAIRTFHLHSRKLFIHHLFFWPNNKRTLEPDWGANAEAEARSERAAAVLYIFFLFFWVSTSKSSAKESGGAATAIASLARRLGAGCACTWCCSPLAGPKITSTKLGIIFPSVRRSKSLKNSI